MLTCTNKKIKNSYHSGLSCISGLNGKHAVNKTGRHLIERAALTNVPKRNRGVYLFLPGGPKGVFMGYLKTGLKTAGQGAGFYGAWRMLEKSEEGVHLNSHEKSWSIMTRAQLQNFKQMKNQMREEEAAAKASELAAKTSDVAAKTSAAKGAGGSISAPYEKFVSAISTFDFMPILILGSVGACIVAVYMFLNGNFGAVAKKVTEDILVISGLAAVSGFGTKLIVNSIMNLNDNNSTVEALQSIVEVSEVRFFIGVFIAGVIVVGGRLLLNGYKTTRAT